MSTRQDMSFKGLLRLNQ